MPILMIVVCMCRNSRLTLTMLQSARSVYNADPAGDTSWAEEVGSYTVSTGAARNRLIVPC